MGESTPADPPAPADRLPRPPRLARVGWYALAFVAAALVISVAFRLDKVSLREPLDYDMDCLLIMPMVKATVENGHHWRIERMGFPGVYELYDFPVVDHAHFAVIWLLGCVFRDWVLVFNLYHLLTWPITAVTAMFAFRRLGLTHPFACAGGILYAFLPYHYLRGETHYFLAAYWAVPLSWLPALALCKGDLPFFTRRPDGTYERAIKTRAAGWQVALAALTASAGAYYAFFACAIYCAAGCYGWVYHRTWRAAVSAAMLAGAVAFFGVMNHMPSIWNAVWNDHARVTERYPKESEIYGLKIAHLVLPIDAHQLVAFRRVKAAYTGHYELNNENACAPLGSIGTIGFVALLAVLVVPKQLGWPYRPAAVLALFILLYATIGGISSVFNLLVFDQIRCPNRFSVYLAFLCLFAPLWWADTYLLTHAAARRFRIPAAVGLVVVGVADVSPSTWYSKHVVEQIETQASRFRHDRDFFARIEDAAPGARLFCLPYMPFPEVPPLYDLKAYEHSRVYLHSNTLVSSYGAIKVRETDEWLKHVTFDGPANRLLRIVVRGFDGMLIDGRGYASQSDANKAVNDVREAVPRAVPLPQIVHDDGRQIFLDLRPYRDWLRQFPDVYEPNAARERNFVSLCFLRGMPSDRPQGVENQHRWVYNRAAFQIVNPSDSTRVFDFAATFSTDHPGDFRVTMTGAPGLTWVNRPEGPGPLADNFTITGPIENQPGTGSSDRRHYRIEIPPGRYTVRLSSVAPSDLVTGDTRPIHYGMTDIRFAEAPHR